MEYKLSQKQLLFDLYVAFETACRHKNNKPYVKRFKQNLHNNLVKLRDELWKRTYQSEPSICFIVNHPKKREVFAANFRDRIVHHLLFNYTHTLFEHTFINDNYSCIKGKGTHFGIKRLKKHILNESNNYKYNCYVLKMDIKGYFMHINRELLSNITISSLEKMATHQKNNKSNRTWNEFIDINFVKYLIKTVSLLNPTIDCIFRSNKEEWNGLADSKSLFKVEKGYGLPIGNLTSQLFSNIFLNVLDQFMKRKLKCKHYGRYVDDFYVVSKDKDFLYKIIPQVEKFLKDELCLEINKGKTTITEVKQGVSFLGAFIKPNRIYVDNKCLKRIKRKLYNFQYESISKTTINSVNSYLGILSHYKSYNIKLKIFGDIQKLHYYGAFNKSMTKFVPYSKMVSKIKDKQ